MQRLIIGLMSGTSVDGIDAALVRVTRTTQGQYAAKVLRHAEVKWPPAMRQRLLKVMTPARTTTEEICELNVLVARAFARAAEKLIDAASIDRRRIVAIGSHGQTISHLPARGATLQLGDVSVIATLTGITTVGNFRPADMAVGGQGAPLVPWTDAALLTDQKQTRAVQNIGGIANVTYLPPAAKRGTKSENVIAFDTGPGNMLIDALAMLGTNGTMTYDHGGRLARRGTLDAPLFDQLRRHPYFERVPPKSTGREEFGAAFAAKIFADAKRRHVSLENLLHTATRLTAWSIVDAYLAFLPALPEEIILCGGGAQNPTLMERLNQELAAATRGTPRVCLIDAFGIPNKAKEACSFALLAAATLDGAPANLPGVTGAAKPVVLGVIARP